MQTAIKFVSILITERVYSTSKGGMRSKYDNMNDGHVKSMLATVISHRNPRY